MKRFVFSDGIECCGRASMMQRFGTCGSDHSADGSGCRWVCRDGPIETQDLICIVEISVGNCWYG